MAEDNKIANLLHNAMSRHCFHGRRNVGLRKHLHLMLPNVPALVQAALIMIRARRADDFQYAGARGIGEFIHRSANLEFNAGLLSVCAG